EFGVAHDRQRAGQRGKHERHGHCRPGEVAGRARTHRKDAGADRDRDTQDHQVPGTERTFQPSTGFDGIGNRLLDRLGSEQAAHKVHLPDSFNAATSRRARSNTSTGCPPETRCLRSMMIAGTPRMPAWRKYCWSARTSSAKASESRTSRARSAGSPASLAICTSVSWSAMLRPSVK